MRSGSEHQSALNARHTTIFVKAIVGPFAILALPLDHIMERIPIDGGFVSDSAYLLQR